jgi:hypothetical protein
MQECSLHSVLGSAAEAQARASNMALFAEAFYTINRELLFQILSKFGIPESMIYMIRRL